MAGANVPKLRFQEFRGEWEAKRLGNFGNFIKGKGISKADIDEQGETACIRYGELYTYYNEIIEKAISRTNVPVQELQISEGNEVIIPASGETSIDIARASCVINAGIALGGDLNIFQHNQNGVFLAYSICGIHKTNIAKLAQGNSVVHLYGERLKSYEIKLPSSQEQTKIAEFLGVVDEKIKALRQNHGLLKDYKRGIMQKIFTQQIRFKKDDGTTFPDWEEKSLIEVACFRRGSFPQPYGLPEWYDEENGMPFVQVYDVDDNFKLKNTTKQKISKLASKQSVFVPMGSLLVTIQGSIGRIAVTQYDAYVDRTLLIFTGFKTEINIRFFSYILFLLFEIEKDKAPGGTIKTITKEVLSDFLILLPHPNEQQKIADFLSSIDNKIDAIQSQIDQMTQFKKGLLQQMFV